MAKPKTVYVCGACGSSAPRWLGRCPACNAWNTLARSATGHPAHAAERGNAAGTQRAELAHLRGDARRGPAHPHRHRRARPRARRRPRARARVVLVGGDPGIGKSTLLLQALAALAAQRRARAVRHGRRVGAQVALRAERLGARRRRRCMCSPTTELEDDLSARSTSAQPRALVVDSIQTMRSPSSSRPPGSVAQLREVRRAPGRSRQAARHRGVPDRPRHQGRRARRSQGARAPGRHGARRSRATPRTRYRMRARHQEPLRPGPRDRRVRDGARGAARGGRPERAVSRRAPARRARARSSCRRAQGTRPLLVEVQALVAPARLRLRAARGHGHRRQPPRHPAGRARPQGRTCRCSTRTCS